MQNYRYLWVFLWLMVSGCSSVSVGHDQTSKITPVLQEKHWRTEKLTSDELSLNVYYPEHLKPSNSLVIYFGESGYRHFFDFFASQKRVALDMAHTQPEGVSMFIQWPCQQISADNSECKSIFAVDKRFDPVVLWSMSDAIDQLKRKTTINQIILVGYGDGGLMASLIAARRHDVVGLVTVATPFDLPVMDGQTILSDEVIREHHFVSLPQIHLVGSDDKNVQATATQQFLHAFPASDQRLLIEEKGFTHDCCWADQWPDIWKNLKSGIPALTNPDPQNSALSTH